MNSHITVQLAEIKEKIESVARAAGRNPDDVKLIAVSKTFPNDHILTAYLARQKLFGENKVQELELKVPALPSDIEWHLIGHLQSNKTAKAAELAHWIHSIDSLKLVKHLDRHCALLNKKIKILLEYNVSGEDSKSGIRTESEAMEIAAEAMKSNFIELKGLMTMAAIDADETAQRKTFAGLRNIRDKLEAQLNTNLPELSMGMSQDFESAIKEGATFVRIGTSIFGKRTYDI